MGNMASVGDLGKPHFGKFIRLDRLPREGVEVAGLFDYDLNSWRAHLSNPPRVVKVKEGS